MTVILESGKQPSLFSKEVVLRLAAISTVAALLLGALVSVLYQQELRSEQRLLHEQGLQRVERETDFIEHELRTIRSDALYLAQQELLQQFLASPQATRQALSREYVRFAEKRQVYDQIRLLDASGMEVVRVNYRDGAARIVPPSELQDKQDRYYFQQASSLAADETFVSEFDLNVEHGAIEHPLRPVLRFVAPVSRSSKHGVMVLNYNGAYLLHRLNRIAVPGRTLLVRHDGHYILGIKPTDAWGWLLDHPHSFSTQFADAWQEMQHAVRGQFTTPQGRFAYRRLAMSHSTETAAPRPAEVYLVSWISPLQQRGAAKRLLTQLTRLAGAAMACIFCLAWYWAWLAALRRAQADSIAESESRLRRLSRQLLTAQEDERRSISRELHDDLGQQVTGIRLGLQTAIQRAELGSRLKLMESLVTETDAVLRSIHRIATRVRPTVLDDLGLRDALESLTEELAKRADLAITLTLDFSDGELDPQVGENIYRIVQEALTNVVKHADASATTIHIDVQHSKAKLVIADDGCGFTEDQVNSRLGLLGMRERVELLGGSFRLASETQTGTSITIEIPLQDS